MAITDPAGDTIHAFNDDDALGRGDATDIAAWIARGRISAGDAVAAAITRLGEIDPVLHSIVCQRFDTARREAAAATPGADRPFAGVPSVIKDNIDLAGSPTGHGSEAVARRDADSTAAFAQMFMATGLIPLAKTRLSEFGLAPTNEFMHAEPARNPWRTTHTTGGSSGSSAALVAAGVVPIAHGNDGGGSIRIPAAACGLVGLKPSRSRMPDNPMAKDAPINIIADGVLTRSVRDTANFFAAAEKHPPASGLAPIGRVDGPGEQTLRIGLTTTLPDGQSAHPDCVAAAERTAELCRGLGHEIEPMTSPLSPQLAADFILYYGMLAASLRHLGRFIVGPGFDGRKLEPMTQHFAGHFRRNMLKFPGALKRLKRQAPAAQRALMSRYDVLLTPTLGHPPAELGYLAPDLDFDTARERLIRFAAFTPAANLTGAPAISLPLGRSADGLPLGVQFLADNGQERTLLELAYALEQTAPWPRLDQASAGYKSSKPLST